ncbi:MAG: cation:proton antiporter [Candidatus Diapherotrites archaeon]|nr:cation:proton antiporter [Candidatus Diapherotrites archaeon]
MEFLLDIAVLLISAKLLGEVAERLRLPELLGAIAAGFLLGPVLGLVDVQNVVRFGQMGLILLLFIAGFREVRVEEIMRNKKSSVLAGTLGALVPLVAGYFLGTYFGFSVITSLFIGSALAASSISISLGSFIEAGRLNTRVGRTVLGSSVVDDVLGLFILAVIVAVATTGSMPSVEVFSGIFFGILLFALVFLASIFLFPLLVRFSNKFKADQAQFSVTMVLVIMLALLAEKFGLSTVLGAFLAGVILSRVPQLATRSFLEKVDVVSEGIFVPLFFAWVGLQIALDAGAITLFTLALIVVALVGKLVGCYVAGALSGFTHVESLALGVGMIPRGEVALVILMLGAKAGVVSSSLFSSFLLLILVSIFLTPVLLAPLLRGKLPK